jgi:hypothetical protein
VMCDFNRPWGIAAVSSPLDQDRRLAIKTRIAHYAFDNAADAVIMLLACSVLRTTQQISVVNSIRAKSRCCKRPSERDDRCAPLPATRSADCWQGRMRGRPLLDPSRRFGKVSAASAGACHAPPSSTARNFGLGLGRKRRTEHLAQCDARASGASPERDTLRRLPGTPDEPARTYPAEPPGRASQAVASSSGLTRSPHAARFPARLTNRLGCALRSRPAGHSQTVASSSGLMQSPHAARFPARLTDRLGCALRSRPAGHSQTVASSSGLTQSPHAARFPARLTNRLGRIPAEPSDRAFPSSRFKQWPQTLASRSRVRTQRGPDRTRVGMPRIGTTSQVGSASRAHGAKTAATNTQAACIEQRDTRPRLVPAARRSLYSGRARHLLAAPIQRLRA